jgi:hypothetical protein
MRIARGCNSRGKVQAVRALAKSFAIQNLNSVKMTPARQAHCQRSVAQAGPRCATLFFDERKIG